LTEIGPLDTVVTTPFGSPQLAGRRDHGTWNGLHRSTTRSAPVCSPDDDPDCQSDPASGPMAGPVLAPSECFDLGPLANSLIKGLPEFLPILRRLVAACEDDPGEPVLLMELADFVAARLAELEDQHSVLERALAVVETLIHSVVDDEIGRELIGYAFFDSFSPENQRRLGPWLGAGSRALLDSLDVSPVE
jgi:hypothetical protein